MEWVNRLFMLVIVSTIGVSSPASSQSSPTITVINMVPWDRSGESYEDSEPSLAVEYGNPVNLVGTAFTPDPMDPINTTKTAPIYYSTDGGATWYVNSILPTDDPYTMCGTNDVSVCFGGMSSQLYIAMLKAGTGRKLFVYASPDFKVSPGNLITEIYHRVSGDQPHIAAVTAWGGPSSEKEVVYVTSKVEKEEDETPIENTSTLELSNETPLTPSSDWKLFRLEEGDNCNQDGPSVLSAPQFSGHVYAAFVRWKEDCNLAGPGPRSADLVLLRDDNWGLGPDAFKALSDDGVQRGTAAIESFSDLYGYLGPQRVISKLALASFSPLAEDDRVYLAWGEGTTADQYKLHLKYSIDGGVTWEPTIVTIDSATNPSLAVNNQGVVGFLYQQIVAPWTSSGHWETHFRTMNSDLSLVEDQVLARMPNTAPAPSEPGPLGDYVQVVSVGKDFYGVFSSMNYPRDNNFPQGVIFHRNVDWPNEKLRALPKEEDPPGTVPAEVEASIDPFFFKVKMVPEENDFYVRDWTKDATDFDKGLEPSSQREFYTTSDVWNRRTTSPGSFINDQPENEMPGSGDGPDGDNWAFARIRRNALPPSGSGSQTVTAHFLVSKFGTGSNFVDANDVDPEVTFSGDDPTVIFGANALGPILTAARPWHLSAVGSSHLCLAVEISTPEDPYVSPSLRGNTPGWSTGTDLRVMSDNNKAQRNMAVLYLAAENLQSVNSSYFAIVHNQATFTRNIVLRCNTSRIVVDALPHASVEVVGGQKMSLRPGQTIVLRNMKPGENRWMGFSTGKPKGPIKSPNGNRPSQLLVYFDEIVGKVAGNGFAIGVQAVPAANLYSENLRFHRSTFARPPLQSFPTVGDLSAPTNVSEAEYLQYLTRFLEEWGRLSRPLVKSFGFKDPFKVMEASNDLNQAVLSGDASRAATLHGNFLNRLDSFVTMVDLSAGDVADILQTVRWQRDALKRTKISAGLPCRDSIVDSSETFIRDYSRRLLGREDYPDYIQAQLPCLRQIAERAPRHQRELLEGCNRMEQHLDNPRALQRAHRDYLLELDATSRH